MNIPWPISDIKIEEWPKNARPVDREAYYMILAHNNLPTDAYDNYCKNTFLPICDCECMFYANDN